MARVKSLSLSWRMLLPLVVIASAIVQPLGGLPRARASSYDCVGNSQTFLSGSGHCYGLNEWDGAINGAFTSMTVPHLVRPTQPSDARNTAEMWMADDNGWIEIGIANGFRGFNGYNINTNYYFWADQCPGSKFFQHPLIAVPAADYAGYVNLLLTKDCCVANQFDGYIASMTYYYTSLQSVGNTMSPKYIQIGTEVYGTAGGSTPSTDFSENEYETVSGGTYYYQYTPGKFPYHPASDWPTTQRWVTVPSPGNNGGDLQVSCPC